jgi:hypothetical protein
MQLLPPPTNQGRPGARPPVSSVAVSGVVSGPPPVQRGPVLFHVGVAAAGPGASVWVLLRVLLFSVPLCPPTDRRPSTLSPLSYLSLCVCVSLYKDTNESESSLIKTSWDAMRRDLSDEFDQPRDFRRLTAFRGKMACKPREHKIPAFATSAFEHEPTTQVCATVFHQKTHPLNPSCRRSGHRMVDYCVGVPCASASWAGLFMNTMNRVRVVWAPDYSEYE